MRRFLMIIQSIILVCTLLSLLAGCAHTELSAADSAISVDRIPVNKNSNNDVKKILNYLADLTEGKREGVIVGQNCGHGSQIADSTHIMGYRENIVELYNDPRRGTGKWVGMIALDYEHDRIFTATQLSKANSVLIDYWKKGGLVTINWAAHSPWLNDESDITKNYGIWKDCRTVDGRLKGVDLKDLLDKSKPVYKVWRKKMDRVAAALKQLEAEGVVVLWRPLQEMNGHWFWWGIKSHGNNGDLYVAIYRDMYNYFTNTKKLNNLLWVFSPDAGSMMKRCYPGHAYVDIVAGTAYNNALNISAYTKYQSFGKVIAMAEFGSDHSGPYVKDGSFDNRRYTQTLTEKYPAVAYWVSWHNWSNGDGTFTFYSIDENKHSKELMENPLTITRDRLQWKDVRLLSK